jgi:hypothetical protein
MTQILRFHWRLYAATLGGLIAAWLLLPHTALVALALSPAAFWFAASLAVSWYVYDRSPLGQYEWLARSLARRPARWVNLHAGVDNAGAVLPRLFPRAEGRTFDIFDAREMTEPSIREARRALHAPPAGAEVEWDALPPQDAAFVIFTAHELRRPEARVRLFRALGRAILPGGEIALVEHLRDWCNFLAFGPGFLHFLSARTWRDAARDAGLRIRREFSVTPFVRVFFLERQP